VTSIFIFGKQNSHAINEKEISLEWFEGIGGYHKKFINKKSKSNLIGQTQLD